MILWDFIWAKMIKFFDPYNVLTWLLSVDRTGRPTCTERARQDCWRAGRPQRASALWNAPVDRDGRPTEKTVLCSRVSVDRVGRLLPQQSDFWPLAVDRAGRPSAVRADFLSQRLVFLAYIYGGFVGCFTQVLEEVFRLVFPTHFSGYIHKF